MAADRIATVQLLLSEVVMFQGLEFIHDGFSNRTGLECPSKGTLFPLRKTLLRLQEQSGAPALCRNKWVPNTIKGIANYKSILSPCTDT